MGLLQALGRRGLRQLESGEMFGAPRGLLSRVARDLPPEPMPRMTPPPREIAPNGMPIRPSEPFRNSLRGGSDDLADAAGMRAERTVIDLTAETDVSDALRRALRQSGARLSPQQSQVSLRTMRVPLSDMPVVTRGVDGERAAQYAGMRTKAPPVLMARDFDGNLQLIDGTHRLAAARARGDASIEVLDASDLIPPRNLRFVSMPADSAPSRTRDASRP